MSENYMNKERVGSERQVVVNAHASQSLTGREVGARVAALVGRLDDLKKAIDKCGELCDSPYKRDLVLKYKAAVIVVNDFGFDVYEQSNDKGKFVGHIVRPKNSK